MFERMFLFNCSQQQELLSLFQDLYHQDCHHQHHQNTNLQTMLSYLCHAVTWSTSTSGARLLISGYQSENILIETICINLWTLLLSLCASSRQSWIVLLSLSCHQRSLLELSFQLNFLTTTAPLILIIVSQMIFNFSLIQLMRDTNKAHNWILKIRSVLRMRFETLTWGTDKESIKY